MSTLSIGIIGQSLAGTSGSHPYSPAGGGQIFFNYELRDHPTLAYQPAADPLPGWPGPGGTIWSRLGYIAAHPGNPKIWDKWCYGLAPINGSSSSAWVPGQPGYTRIQTMRQRLAAVGMPIKCWIWMNGELDGMSDHPPDFHFNNVRAMVYQMRADGDNAPVFVAMETTYQQHAGAMCGPMFQGLWPEIRAKRVKWQTRVQSEQYRLPDPALGIYRGADMDLIDCTGRYDGGHLNAVGAYFAAEMWYGVIRDAHSAGIIAA